MILEMNTLSSISGCISHPQTTGETYKEEIKEY